MIAKLLMWMRSVKTPYEFNIPIKRIPILNAGAITLFPVILYCQGYRTHCIEQHERYHWNHIVKTGIIPWYVLYITAALVLAAVYLMMYRRLPPQHLHPLEYEPTQRQWECEASHNV